jgi:hypothetical protein
VPTSIATGRRPDKTRLARLGDHARRRAITHLLCDHLLRRDEVTPETAERDLDTVATLRRHFDHNLMGIYEGHRRRRDRDWR